MAAAGKTRIMIENMFRDGSLKWLIGNRSSFREELEEMGRSPNAPGNWIRELSPIANIVVRRCSKILGVPAHELQEAFNNEALNALKNPSHYARNFLEYCAFRTLALSTQTTGHLTDKRFRRLTYDMMLAWESPAASSQPVDEDATVGLEAFSRIAPAVPIIANVIISENLFEVLTSSTGGRLAFTVYEKYLNALERAIKKLKGQTDSSLLSTFRSSRGEKILEVDGTVTTQPVLEHIGMSAWPGRLILTDHALYFEALCVVSFDKAKVYDLSDDLKQVIKPELTGPWGTRLFDKAVSYKSINLPEPILFEFPELKGHSRRDYWLAIIREVLYVHRFIRKFQITGVERDEALSKAVLGILRLQAVQEISSTTPVRNEDLLTFNVCDQLPGGDLILETLANLSSSRKLDRSNSSDTALRIPSMAALAVVSNLGSMFGNSGSPSDECGIVVGEVAVGEMTALERSVKESKTSYKKVVLAQATVDGVKVDGIDTNLAVMKELLFPILELSKKFQSLFYWEDSTKSAVFCVILSYIIFRGWLGYACAIMLVLISAFMVVTRFVNQGEPVNEVRVVAPPPMNTMEQLLAVQNAISHAEAVIQDGNIALLKLRGLLCAIFPQASDKFAAVLFIVAVFLAFAPLKYVLLLTFLEVSTRYSPPRKASTERLMRRMKEWWFSIPAAPVVLERETDDKKRK
uniref:Uncharacterized protein n=2 Tax=Kalanchoe fedtschenkoi TaxID=63787 RepID=A0A7N0TMW6_KALFE